MKALRKDFKKEQSQKALEVKADLDLKLEIIENKLEDNPNYKFIIDRLKEVRTMLNKSGLRQKNYAEIDNRIKTSFPHKFEEDKERVQETASSPAQVVSGSSRSSPSSRKKIKLSQEDLRLAQKWNIPLETYAAQKLKVHQADGDYTDIK